MTGFLWPIHTGHFYCLASWLTNTKLLTHQTLSTDPIRSHHSTPDPCPMISLITELYVVQIAWP